MNGENGSKSFSEADYFLIMYDLDRKDQSNGKRIKYPSRQESKARRGKLPRSKTVFIHDAREILANSK